MFTKKYYPVSPGQHIFMVLVSFQRKINKVNKAISKTHTYVLMLRICKQHVRLFSTILGNVTIDVNGIVAFFKFSQKMKQLYKENLMLKFHQITIFWLHLFNF